MHQPRELAALIDLLGDPDPAVVGALASRLESDSHLLDRVWLTAEAAGPIPEPLAMIALRADAEALVDAYAAAEDLETGVWLLARLHLPRTDHRAHGAPQLDALAARVANLIADGASPDGRTSARFLCEACGFAGDREAYDDPANSFLPQVLERRLGLPIALTVLWMLIGRRLGLTCEGIALPGHVLGRWAANGAVGYLDLFAGGREVERQQLDLRARLAGEQSAEPYLAAASDRALLKRLARNLAVAYLKREDQLRATIAHALATV